AVEAPLLLGEAGFFRRTCRNGEGGQRQGNGGDARQNGLFHGFHSAGLGCRTAWLMEAGKGLGVSSQPTTRRMISMWKKYQAVPIRPMVGTMPSGSCEPTQPSIATSRSQITKNTR